MKAIFFTLIFSLAILISAFCQSEQQDSKTVADRFETFYNNRQYDSIFNMYSGGMKNALPLTKSNEFLSGLQSKAGAIVRRDFVKYKESYAVYKTKFERALFAFSLSLDNNALINGMFIRPFTDETLPMIERNTTKLKLPFRGEWTVIWGGDTKELNYHVESQAQKNAFDIVVTDKEGKSHKTTGQANEDYYAFGKGIFAPCDGVVVLVVDGVKDNKPGDFNPIYIPGNSVIIKTLNKEYLVFAHFKQHSIKVKEGQQVKQGDLLGLCGNSGNSSEPHLHFHIQNVENMNVATGVKCYFDKIFVNGELKQNYSPVKNDKIKN